MVDATTSALLSGQSAALTSQAQVDEDFTRFLKLLTTQMTNQDPLEPMDTSEFTNQLVQFSGIEQQIATNKNLESLLLQSNQNTQVQALGYIGKEVQYVGAKTGVLQDGELKIRYASDQLPDDVTLQFVDGNGSVVRTVKPAENIGPQEYVWDGKDDLGNQLPDGNYSVNVNAIDATEEPINTALGIFGKVNSVNTTNGDISLSIGDYVLNLDNVIKVNEI